MNAVCAYYALHCIRVSRSSLVYTTAKPLYGTAEQLATVMKEINVKSQVLRRF